MNAQNHNIATYRRLFFYLAGYWKIFALSVVAMLITATTIPLFASLIKPLIDEGFVEKNMQAMKWIPFAIVGLFFIRGIFNFINEYLTAYLSGHLVARLRTEMFDKMLRLPVGYYQDNPSGRVLSRITNDVSQITDAGFNIITVSAKDGATIIGLLGYLAYLDWQLMLVTFIAFPIVALCIRIVSHRLRRLSHENQQYLGAMMQSLNETVNGMRMVRIYGAQQQEKSRFGSIAQSVRRNLVKQVSASSANTAVTQFLVSIALSAFIYFAASRARSGTFSAGDFMSFLTALVMLFDPTKRITGITQTLQRGLAAAESVFNFLDLPEENTQGKLRLEHSTGSLLFQNVTLRYDGAGKNSLENINLKVDSGKTIALVGASGCGKSSLVNLIARFFDVSSGSLLLDGHPIEHYTLADVRRQIALVSQEVVLFNGSIRANVAYGQTFGASDEEIIAALQSAHAWDFVQKLPDGLNTMIGEKGTALSGGQRQRLAIARALLKDAPILILDEATSALDSESEKAVQTALNCLMKNRTTIVIAHRLSTVENADEIIVMDDGKIIEHGTHRELLARSGRYCALRSIQFNP